jgi:hypothetical protein
VKRRERGEHNGTRPLSGPVSNSSGAMAAALVVLAFCLLLLWHNPLLFWNDDYEISILPVFADVARSWSEGHWPLLSPYSWICGNLAGEFQYGTFSLFINVLVVLIWKFPLVFSQQAAALSVAHLMVLAAGGYLLARQRRLNAALALMVASIAALNGWIICWGATDWFGALGAFAWLPWCWWGMERALDTGRSHWRFLWPAPFVYLLVTGGFPYTVLMLGLLGLWLTLKSLGETRRLSSINPLAAGVLLGLGMAAPAWLALLQYTQGSTREAQATLAHWQWLVPPAALPGFILPNWTVNWADFMTRLRPRSATELACGLVAPVVLVAALFTCGRELVRRLRSELGLLAIVLLIAMLPSVNVFRWSFRWLPFFHLVLAICAAHAWQLMEERPIRVRPGFWSLGLVLLTTIAMLLFHAAGSKTWPFLLLIIGLAILWIVLEATRLKSWIPPLITLLAFGATYFFLPTNGGVPRFNFSQQMLSPAPLDKSRLYLSLYPPPETAYRLREHSIPVGQVVRPGSTSMWAGVHLINGYSPIRAAAVARTFVSYIHGEIDPNMANYLLGWQSGSDGLLAKLGVDGIIVAREFDFAPKPAGAWQLVFSSDEGRVYHRRVRLASVRSVRALDSLPDEQFAVAKIAIVEDSRNRVVVDVQSIAETRPALLTFSRPYFRGYQVRLGSRVLPVKSYRDFIPVVEIPPGTSGRLVLSYRPAWLLWGGAVAAGCALVFVIALVFAGRELMQRRLSQRLYI